MRPLSSTVRPSTGGGATGAGTCPINVYLLPSALSSSKTGLVHRLIQSIYYTIDVTTAAIQACIFSCCLCNFT